MNQEPTKQDMEALEAQAEKISQETGKDFSSVLQDLFNEKYVYGNRMEAKEVNSMTNERFENPLDADQTEHDRWMAAKSPEEINLLAKNLANLARSKGLSGEGSSSPSSSASSDRTQPEPFTEAELEMAKALGYL